MKPGIECPPLALFGTLVFSLLMSGAVAQESGKAETITFKDGTANVDGTLKTEDGKDNVQKQPCKVFTIEFKRGHNYKIEMSSKEIDSYLRLEDVTGKEVAKDDDSAGLVNARIQFHCRVDGAHRVICTTYGGGVGPFRLTIQETPSAMATQLKLKDAMAAIDGKLIGLDAMDAVQTRSVCKIYSVQLAKGKSYQMDMTSKDLDSFLRLEDAAGKELAKDDDGGGGRNACIQFACLESGEYRVIATTFFGGTGHFSLTIKEK